MALFLTGIVLNIVVKWTLHRHMKETGSMRGTGGELALYLVESARLHGVSVGNDGLPDHYDPVKKRISLSPRIYATKSLSAVVVAAHEFGHALQDAEGMKALKARTLVARALVPLDKFVSVSLVLLPVLALAAGAAALIKITLFIVVGTMALKVLFHLITLPVELDASFNRALPVLEQGGFISAEDKTPARRILLAAALTYVAGAVGSVFNVFFWLRVLR